MPETSPYESVRDLLRDPAMGRLLDAAHEDYLPWDELIKMRLPSSLSAVETWDLLLRLRQSEALKLPMPRHDDEPYWYTRTRRLDDGLSVIDRTCGPDSYLYRTITAGQGRRFMVKSRIGETVAAAQMDNLDISRDAAKTLLRLDRQPHGSAERVLVNTMRAMNSLAEYVDRPFSFELFGELRDLLVDGLDPTDLPRSTPPIELAEAGAGFSPEGLTTEVKAAHLCAFANNDSGNPHDHPIVRALLLADMLRTYHPLPDMNSQVGRLMFQLYAMKNGLPVLGLLPITSAKIMWFDGMIDVAIDRESFLTSWNSDRHDITPYLTLQVELALRALNDLDTDVRRAAERDEHLRGILRGDSNLNHRQRLILGRALRNPEAEFRIGYHKTNHAITYLTARRDLQGLTDAGYLVCASQGRSLVFSPAPGLEERIGARSAGVEQA